MRPNLYSIQCLRGIAALLVLSCHIGAIETLYLSESILPSWGKYGVDLFFVISGFVMGYTTAEHWGKPKQAAPFLLKRIFRIYPVYWQFTLVVLAVIFLMPSAIKSGDAAQASVLKSLLLWPQKMDPVLGVGWSLVYEMYFYLVFCAAFMLPRRFSGPALLIWAALLAAAQFSGIAADSQSPEIWVITSPLCFEFMAGCALAALYRKNIKLNAWLLLAIAVTWAITMNSWYEADKSFAERVLVWGLPSALALYAALMLEKTHPNLFPQWLQKIGDASYSLYLSHTLLVSAMGTLAQAAFYRPGSTCGIHPAMLCGRYHACVSQLPAF